MTQPVVARTRAELEAALKPVRAADGRVAFVPTMGALHEGHASLMRAARERVTERDVVVVSIFVNPMQFAAGEDLDRYPRTFDADLAICAEQGVDVVFAPTVDEVYPGGEPQVSVEPGPLGGVLEGAARPTHFRGVLTVVAKLFGLVRPDVAVFGQKDYQQLTLIRRMVADLCLGIDIVGGLTVREDDGLALSSRNRYLDPEQRRAARSLSQALRAGAAASADGPDAVRRAAAEVLQGAEGVEVDYLELTDPDLGPAPASGEARLLVAARVGNTRLLDNIALTLGR
ncbi:pantoate--beta-alanine ligase [Microbacterium sp.]|uniref:pantoate--beta-alanine ligase n=1 Tax=Microbacterium sp. TaxID=51671 RepID=UPI003735EEAC